MWRRNRICKWQALDSVTWNQRIKTLTSLTINRKQSCLWISFDQGNCRFKCRWAELFTLFLCIIIQVVLRAFLLAVHSSLSLLRLKIRFLAHIFKLNRCRRHLWWKPKLSILWKEDWLNNRWTICIKPNWCYWTLKRELPWKPTIISLGVGDTISITCAYASHTSMTRDRHWEGSHDVYWCIFRGMWENTKLRECAGSKSFQLVNLIWWPKTASQKTANSQS